ncbi:MAG: putative membrane protein YhhN [Flavobacteriaceae bacterium]|jgi:uncharacterized membrane protein YhhN
MKVKLASGFYFLIGIVHIMAEVAGSISAAEISKVMLMPALIYLVFAEAQGMVTLARLLLAVGLIFSWVGDMLLTQESEMYFLGGLGAFLVAQLIYTLVMHKSAFDKIVFKSRPLIPIMVFGVILLALLIPNTGSLAFPIIIYAFCILLMVSSAVLRRGLTSDDSFNYTIIGAVLFVLSDSCIAIDKFVTPIPLAGFFIMTSYIFAQYYIVKGIMVHPGEGS